MKQVQFRTFGQPSVVANCVEVPDVGPPAAWEVIVDVEAFPINPADLAMLAGNYGKLPKLPATIGMEAVGRIRVCGSAVKDLTVGDRVVILANDNWCEQRKVPAAAVHRVGATGEVASYAGLKVNPATAYLLIKQAAATKGEWLLQTAPLSSVGRFVIQLAKLSGLRTINVIRRESAAAEVLALGGDVALPDGADLAERVRAATQRQPVRVAFDAVGGPGVQRLADALADGGRIVNYGMLSTESCGLRPEALIFRGISLNGFWLSSVLNRLTLPERTELYSKLAEYVATGVLQTAIDSQFEITRIQDALRRAEQGERRGKVLVTVPR